jgi:cell division protein FtsB
MVEKCIDNREKLIQKYKDKLLEGTNIHTSQKEMEVIDNILFRLWQMGWLRVLEDNERIERLKAQIEKMKQDVEELKDSSFDAGMFFAVDEVLIKWKKELAE